MATRAKEATRMEAAIWLSVCIAQATQAATFELVVDSAQSPIAQMTAIDAPFAGTFMGDFDSRANPSGTKTIPGLFGGSGNNPIDYSATLVGEGGLESHASGGLTIELDQSGLSASIDGLVLDLLSDDTGAFGLKVEIEYDTFHTQQPTAIFPGGFTIPIPLGELAITSFVATQVGGPVDVVLLPSGQGSYAVVGAVEAEVAIVGTLLGEPLDLSPQVLTLPFAGTLVVEGNQATFTATLAQAISQEIPLELPAFEAVPLGLPTILPPGGTANLLLSGTFASVSLDVALDATIIAVGDLACSASDFNCDGFVDGADLAVLLAGWGTSAGDLTGDGVTNGADLGALLASWTGDGASSSP